ncbi:DMT family transporter [Paramaledivibacter caminithermalis]|jgi:drug/metabolite transporter (DMT)-like permease|uniref:Permease of the drug/metabolite transporter (DMT) superfamily n=1 Tax=Paramaledivibacter caminithermalis (strain DSM 15212 / CIP 107654 / DViRD3) TaxID=1121301 RepID=A0A1M6MNE6_PARC5|nr:DMT family transporter [Paramaledivibacter caminithermalis]SHJ84959.1 Permease of the drug/metabolite transporter (DMT) superfamily [Paramaledivibacter caminithermalis DSM 15212]
MGLSKSAKGVIMILLAGCLWGTVGSIVKILNSYNISSQAIVFWRVFLAFIILYSYIYITNKDLLKIDKKGILYAALMGLICQSVFNTLYFTAIEKTTISTAVILLYTSPIFIIIISKILYKESFTKYKALSLITCVIGCFLTVTGGNFKALEFNITGILCGIGAGFTYSLYTIFSKGTLEKYNQWTMTIYMLGFGSLFILFISKPSDIFFIDYNLKVSSIFFCIAILTTIMPYTLYSTGLSYGVESSKAGIIATIEVVMAVTMSFLFFNETIIGWKLLGVFMVLLSVLIIRFDKIRSQPNGDLDCS